MQRSDGMPHDQEWFGRILSVSRPVFLFVVEDKPLSEVISTVLKYMGYKVLHYDRSPEQLVIRRPPGVHVIVIDIVSSRQTLCGLPQDLCARLPPEAVLVCSQDLEKPFFDCHCHAYFLRTPFNVAQFSYALEQAMELVYNREFSDDKRIDTGDISSDVDEDPPPLPSDPERKKLNGSVPGRVLRLRA
jgi:DNA-binding NtrC family response regulator